ncbi:MAG: hypothetical protein K6F89_07135, partial [Prevotella sp.]|nr:hypothetical protein [Prevotella sp.]
MKKSIHYLLILCTVMLTSCNLFIDEDLERQLLEYSGKGYDDVVSDTTENYSIEYKYKNTTLELNADNPLTKHILRVESNEAARCHIIHFDSSVSVDELPRVGQCIVSNNQELFPYGLCDMVGVVESENGEHILTCKGVDVNEAFDYLNFHASVPLENPFDEYNMYDEEGNLLYHVDNREKNARMQTRGSNGDDYFNVNIPFDIPWSDTRLTNLRKKFYSDTFKLTITGGLKGKLYTECDYSSDEGLKAGLRFKDGSIDIGIKLEVILGQSGMQKIFGNDDLLNGKVRVSVGPVVIVPVFGFSINIQVWDAITTEVKYHKPLDFELGFKDGDFYSNDNSGDGTITTSFEVSGNFHFPVVKLSLGFGLFTSDLSIRFETFFRLATKISAISGSKTYNPSGAETGPVDISLSPKVTTDFQIGFAVALVAKGMIIGKIVEKIKEHVKECSTLNEAMESYVGNGTFMDWIKFQEGKTDGIDPSVLAAMNRIVGGLEGDKRKDA